MYGLTRIVLFTAKTEVRRCVLKFCHNDKISTTTCIFDEAEIYVVI